MLMNIEIQNRIKDAGIVAVLIFHEKKEIRPTIEALSSGGVSAIELTLRTPIALEAITIVHTHYPHILCGAGTVLSPRQISDAQKAGADFAVAPGLNRKVMDEAKRMGLPFAPGIITASDIESALEYDCTLLKFFPAEKIGGIAYLKSLNAPYQHLGLSFLPLGGINTANLTSYAKEPIIAGIGGSWIASSSLIAAGDWDAIEKNACSAVKRFREERKQ
jgi:2-dehydro-3-deoxyphosphogluconate aldolase/(4S)-4-hydroxy-2-oxoglutarate aldolase